MGMLKDAGLGDESAKLCLIASATSASSSSSVFGVDSTGDELPVGVT
jgi:hypothetical protein